MQPNRPKVDTGCHSSVHIRRLLLSASAGLAALVGLPSNAPAQNSDRAQLELVMVEEAGCGYCIAWHQQIGQGYAKSDEGRLAPLRVVDVRSAAARDLGRIVYTPTFVLRRHGGGEVGRIVGFPGADAFWGLLTQLVAKASRDPVGRIARRDAEAAQFGEVVSPVEPAR
ncbi:MAG: hypothetical protein NW217_15465 [Hyphomicrobiaceae bacterium]|nr:hypothetical protein [Hyphomicrobiaceae bacterium]